MSEEQGQPQQQQHPEEKPQNQEVVPQVQQPQYYPPTQQPYQYKIFINQSNSYVGSQLVEVMRNDDEIQVNPNIIYSNLSDKVNVSGDCEEVCKHIQFSNKPKLNRILQESDIVIFHLGNHNLQEFQYVIKFLRQLSVTNLATQPENQRKKKVICISSIKTWSTNKTQEGRTLNDNILVRNNINTYMIELQNLCLDINNQESSTIEAFMIYSGIIYGYGQNQLFSRFKIALEQQESLLIYGTGDNYLPMIHLEDLCLMAKQLAFNGSVCQESKTKRRLNYYLGVDHSSITQSQLVNKIASTLGNGRTENIPVQNAFLKSDFDAFMMDIKVPECSRCTLSNWHSQNGIIDRMGEIVSQFNEYRGLKPNKIVVIGAPATGKTTISQFLRNSYGLPTLTISSVIKELQEEEDEFAQQMKIKIEELRAERIEEERKAFEEAKKKKKGKKDAGEQFDPDKVVARLSDQDLVKIFKRRMNQSDCLNKGYILDGWPKSAEQCSGLFYDNSEQNTKIFPNACFFLEAGQQEVKQRIKNIPPQKRQGTHWNEEATVRRFQTYNKHSEEGSAKSFFDGKVDIHQVSFTYEDSQQFVKFIERNGPLGFKKKPKPVENQPQENQEQKEDEKVDKEKKDEENESEEEEECEPEDEQEEIEEDNGQFDIEKLTAHQKEILNEKSRPIRQYLIDNVIPQITEGLLQICKQAPRDPIPFMIKYLELKQKAKSSKKQQ